MRHKVVEALRLLAPSDVAGVPKIRIGGPHDGGYVMLDCLRARAPVMSFGIGPSMTFDLDMAGRGHPVLMFDHTIERLPDSDDGCTWFREGIGHVPGGALPTLAEHMAKLPDGAKDPLLKLDVEGAEWDVLSHADPAVLARFSQIVIEFHDLAQLAEPAFNARALRALQALGAFAPIHVHANNFADLALVEGLMVADVMEVTYVRRDLVSLRPSATSYPTPLDSPCFAGAEDTLLWFFPFLPGSTEATLPADDNALSAPAIRHRPRIDPPDLWELRCDLAASLRMAARMGLHEGICNHFSAMLPGSANQFLVNRYGLAFAEATASSLLICDFDGNVLHGEGEPEATAFFIHARLHKSLPRARVALHTHMPYATALAMVEGEPLVWAGQSALKFLGRTVVDPDYNGLALDEAEGDRIAASMGDADIVFLRNHGVMVTGRTVAAAFDDLYYLERACEAQVLAMSTGRKLCPVPPEIAQHTATQMRGDTGSAALHLASLRRRLDREEPEYAR